MGSTITDSRSRFTLEKIPAGDYLVAYGRVGGSVQATAPFQLGGEIQSVTDTAIDLLQNVPSVDVDIDGNISLRAGNPRLRPEDIVRRRSARILYLGITDNFGQPGKKSKDDPPEVRQRAASPSPVVVLRDCHLPVAESPPRGPRLAACEFAGGFPAASCCGPADARLRLVLLGLPGVPGVARREFPLTLRRAFGFLSGSKLTLSMANTKSAIKAARKSARFTLRNQGVKTRLKTLHKKLDAAIKAGEAAATKAAAAAYASAMDKAVKSGVVHKNAASRAKARAAKYSFAK